MYPGVPLRTWIGMRIPSTEQIDAGSWCGLQPYLGVRNEAEDSMKEYRSFE